MYGEPSRASVPAFLQDDEEGPWPATGPGDICGYFEPRFVEEEDDF
jgi:hypothetical protein